MKIRIPKRNTKDKSIAPIMEHIIRLRHTIIACLAVIIVSAIACFGFLIEPFMKILIKPLEGINTSLVFITVSESFVVEMKVGLIAGIILSAPIVIFLVWHFVAPAFFPNEKRKVIIYSLNAIILFAGGVCFCYLIIFPYSLNFFLGMTSIEIESMLTINKYMDFLFNNMISFGLVFETPIVTYFLIKTGVVSSKKLGKLRKYIVLICFVIGAVITPPDVISQLIVALPMYFMYEIGLLLGRISGFRKSRAEIKRKRSERAIETNSVTI